MKSIAEEQVLARLSEDNPWWTKHGQQHSYFDMPHRAYLDLFWPLVEAAAPKRAVILLGPRRVGKTVMIHQAISRLMTAGVSPNDICYVNLEVPTYNGLRLEDFLKLFPKASGTSNPKARLFVFFDEIQYLRNWEVDLKAIVDSQRNIKCVASGSAAAALKLKSDESGAGRFTDFMLPPVTFYEFLELQGHSGLVQSNDEFLQLEGATVADIQALNIHFVEYLNYGGYPEVIFSKEIRANPGRFIRSDIIDKVLLRDLPSLYGIQDIQELNSLFTSLAYNTGNEVSLEELSQSSGVAKNTIKRYIEYLEAAFLLKCVHRIDRDASRFNRANYFKVYLTNPCMRSALFSPLAQGDEGIGHLVETGIFAQWFHSETIVNLYYARWKDGEVDIVFSLNPRQINWAVEVKWSDAYPDDPGQLKSLCKLLQNHPTCEASITTKTVWKYGDLGGVPVRFIPASVYAYILGHNIIKSRGQRPRKKSGLT